SAGSSGPGSVGRCGRKAGSAWCGCSPSAPDPETVGAVLTGLDDDDALTGEGHLVGLPAAAADQRLGTEAALALHLEIRGPRDQGVRVDVRLVLPATAVDDDRLAARGQRDPALPGDPGVPQALAGELRQALDPLHAPAEVRVEGEQVGGVDGDAVAVEVDHDDVISEIGRAHV